MGEHNSTPVDKGRNCWTARAVVGMGRIAYLMTPGLKYVWGKMRREKKGESKYTWYEISKKKYLAYVKTKHMGQDTYEVGVVKRDCSPRGCRGAR